MADTTAEVDVPKVRRRIISAKKATETPKTKKSAKAKKEVPEEVESADEDLKTTAKKVLFSQCMRRSIR
jgi:hypothetical protein